MKNRNKRKLKIKMNNKQRQTGKTDTRRNKYIDSHIDNHKTSKQRRERQPIIHKLWDRVAREGKGREGKGRKGKICSVLRKGTMQKKETGRRKKILRERDRKGREEELLKCYHEIERENIK